MASNLLRSGYSTLEYEIAQEKASVLGRLGHELETALKALGACPRTADSDQKRRNRLVEKAGDALWHFVMQREACGLNNIAYVMQVYGVPDDVYARMSPLPIRSCRSANEEAPTPTS